MLAKTKRQRHTERKIEGERESVQARKEQKGRKEEQKIKINTRPICFFFLFFLLTTK